MEKEIKITLPDKKLDALNFYIQKRGTTIEAELGNALLKLYDKCVPPTVREYLEAAYGEENG